MSVRPAKTLISLGICPVWSESSLSTWRKLGSLATHWAHSEDSDQTGRMPRLIWVFAGHRLILLVLSCRSSIIIIILFLQTDSLRQTVKPRSCYSWRSSLIRVCIVSHSAFFFWLHYSMVISHCTNDWAHSEDSDQTWQRPRLISVCTGRTVILLVLSWGGSNLRKITAIFWVSEFLGCLRYTCMKPLVFYEQNLCQ